MDVYTTVKSKTISNLITSSISRLTNILYFKEEARSAEKKKGI